MAAVIPYMVKNNNLEDCAKNKKESKQPFLFNTDCKRKFEGIRIKQYLLEVLHDSG